MQRSGFQHAQIFAAQAYDLSRVLGTLDGFSSMGLFGIKDLKY